MSEKWYRHGLRVQYHETDQMGVVHHSNYIKWFEVGRTEMIRRAGISYAEMEELGLLLPVVDVSVKYRQPARYDDQVHIYTRISKLSPVVMEFSYEVRLAGENRESEDLLATGVTHHMWINDAWRPARLNRRAPEVYEELLKLADR